jgi:4-hydroxybenzoate polyprenyltransferase
MKPGTEAPDAETKDPIITADVAKKDSFEVGRFDVIAIAVCYALLLFSLLWVAYLAGLNDLFWFGWVGALVCAIYHVSLVRTRQREACFKAFRQNNWLGAFLFLGIVLGLLG